ncbi:MAG TPA: ABC transporter permease [Terriglobales bacterium]|nr:ABC transporter permease [Terriglobales bacterium]
MNDLKFAFRQLLKNPGFTAVAVLTLALGIGGSTAVFSLINGIIFRPLPYREAERLVMVWTESSASRNERSSYGNYADWKKQCSAFEELDLYDGFTCLLTVAERTEKVSAARVSAGFFSLLGASPALGQSFSAEEEKRGSHLAIVSHHLWQDWFAGASNVVGRTMEIDGRAAEIIGVMPEGFAFPGEDTEFWELQPSEPAVARGIGQWFVVGRLKQDRSLAQAETELRGVAARLASEYANENQGLRARIVRLSEEITGSNLRLAFWILFSAVLSVLLIGCSNLLNLLLVRGVARLREMATRLALGASQFRMVRQLGVECLPIGLLGGLGGVALADGIVRVVRAFAGNRIPRLGDVHIDAVVICFALALTALVTLIFGVIPGLQTRHLDIHESLKEGARGTGASRQASFRHALIIGEVALAFLFLFGAGLLLRSFQSVRALDAGFNPEHVFCANVKFPKNRSDDEALLFYQELIQRFEALPVVESAGLIDDVFGGGNAGGRIAVEGAAIDTSAEETQVRRDSITSSWFRAIGAPLLRGRLFDESDRKGSPPVAIINEMMARRFWPGRDPLGRRFKIGRADSNAPWLTVVGVASDMRRERLERAPLPQVFRPLAQLPSMNMELLVRTASNPPALAERVRQEVHALDKSVAVYGISTLERRLGASLFERRFQTSLLSAFSLVALLLAGIGTYAVMHFSVQQRGREIGVRMALGAERIDVFALIIGQGLKTVLIGVGFGVGLALGLTRLMQRLLFEIKPTDPLTFAGVSFLLLGIALFACWLPARNAANVDPMEALRTE